MTGSGALTPSYGLAESTCAVTLPAPGVGLNIATVSDASGPHTYPILGEAVPGMELRIVTSERYSENADREIGEIEIRGTSMMDGYLGVQAKATVSGTF